MLQKKNHTWDNHLRGEHQNSFTRHLKDYKNIYLTGAWEPPLPTRLLGEATSNIQEGEQRIHKMEEREVIANETLKY